VAQPTGPALVTDNSLSVISKFTQFDATVMATITEGLSLTLTGRNHISSDKPWKLTDNFKRITIGDAHVPCISNPL